MERSTARRGVLELSIHQVVVAIVDIGSGAAHTHVSVSASAGTGAGAAVAADTGGTTTEATTGTSAADCHIASGTSITRRDYWK